MKFGRCACWYCVFSRRAGLILVSVNLKEPDSVSYRPLVQPIKRQIEDSVL
jgi:hypothetical protein